MAELRSIPFGDGRREHREIVVPDQLIAGVDPKLADREQARRVRRSKRKLACLAVFALLLAGVLLWAILAALTK
jgi:hypothetical protein